MVQELSATEYLNQLLQDKTTVSKMPKIFLHSERLLDEGKLIFYFILHTSQWWYQSILKWNTLVKEICVCCVTGCKGRKTFNIQFTLNENYFGSISPGHDYSGSIVVHMSSATILHISSTRHCGSRCKGWVNNRFLPDLASIDAIGWVGQRMWR